MAYKTKRSQMMRNYAGATVEGFVTRNPSIRKTKTGKNVCNFSIAINHYSKEDSDSKVSYIDVETWEKLAEICSGSITKGKRIMIAGALRQDRWEGKDGKSESRIKIVGNEIIFLEPKKDLSHSNEAIAV
jgi:single-strand DNA-binding protein